MKKEDLNIEEKKMKNTSVIIKVSKEKMQKDQHVIDLFLSNPSTLPNLFGESKKKK